MVDTNKLIGRVIKVSKTGWGFITAKEIEFTRIFFHWTALRQDTIPFLELRTGMWVEFTPIQIPGKGWRAVHIKVVEKEKHHEPDTEPEVEVSALPEQSPESTGIHEGD